MTMRLCVECGAAAEGSRCTEHRLKDSRPKPAAANAAYDYAWKRLSRRARALQPFCVDCGTTTDLQTDHTPEAWQRKERGLAIRLEDVDVVCGACNRARGAARGDNVTRGPGGMTQAETLDSPRLHPGSASHTRTQGGEQ